MQTTLRLCHAAKGWCCVWEQFPQEFGGKCDPLPFMCGVLNSTCIYQLETPKPPDECPSNQRPRQGSGCLSWLLPNRLAVEGCQRQEEERAHSPRTRKASFAGSCKRWSCVWENIEEIQNHSALESGFSLTPSLSSTQAVLACLPRALRSGLCLAFHRAHLGNVGSEQPWVRLLQGPVSTCSHYMTMHPTRDDSDLSCGEFLTPNSPQQEADWKRGSVCWWGEGRREWKGRVSEER